MVEKFGIGQAVRRREDERLLKGEGNFIDDVTLPGQAFGVVLRSPHAHARILSIDTADAASMPGVIKILTIEHCRMENLGPIPSMTAIDGLDQETLQHPDRYPLADGKANYVGEPVAFIVAGTRAQALDAADAVIVDYEPLAAVVDPASALDPESPKIWPDFRDNRAFSFTKGDAENTDKVFASAPKVVSLDFINNRLASNPIETRGSIGEYDPQSGKYTLHVSGQAVHGNKMQMAQGVFRIEPDKLRVVAGDVGGGFGSKNFVYPENILVLLAAKFTGHPVKWIADRTETFFAETHGRDHVTHAELALDDDNRFLGLRVSTTANMGAYLSTFGPLIPTQASCVSMGGSYNIPAVFMEVRGAFTNTVPVDAYRGAGRPESAYLIERVVEVAARELGCPPDELRRRNYVDAFPHTTSFGLVIDCGDFEGTYEMAAQNAALDGVEERRREAAKRGKILGVGISSYLELTLGQPVETSGIRFDGDGKVSLVIGTQSTGQGHFTAYSQIMHETLGIEFDDIEFVQGDTDLVPTGGGHGGSRSLMVGGNALLKTSEEVREKGRAAAAHLLDVDASEIDFADGLYAVRGTNTRMTLREVEDALRDADDLPDGMEPTLSTSATFERTRNNYPNGCHIAEVEVDAETGKVDLVAYTVVDDFGRIINPLIAAGQVLGGTVQGIGQAMMEEVVYDKASGQIFTGSLMDYALPRAGDLPWIGVEFNPNAPTDTNPLGVKGAGEAGATGAPAAIANAVLDALKDKGVRHLEMPFTPEKVWRALNGA